MKSLLTPFVLATLSATSIANAEIVQSAPDHFTLRHEGYSTLSPDQMWDRLIDPASWWHPDHTYSGKSENLSFDPKAGGLWQENWDKGSVTHGEVLIILDGQKIVMDAPFGPLSELAVQTVWTITLSAHETGTKVVFAEIVNGSLQSDLEDMAKAVDFVKTEAMTRLIGDTAMMPMEKPEASD